MAGRLLLALIAGLLAIQAAVFFWMLGIRESELRRASVSDRSRLLINAHTLLDRLDVERRDALLPSLTFFSHTLKILPAPDFAQGDDETSLMFQDRLRAFMVLRRYNVDVYNSDAPSDLPEVQALANVEEFSPNWRFRLASAPRAPDFGNTFKGKAALRLKDGDWLEAEFIHDPNISAHASGFILALAAQFLLQILLAWAAVRYIVRPLRQLAAAAEHLTPDSKELPFLPESGPSEVRHAVLKFREMHSRIREFLDQRLRLLASLSHDLRSPVTRLRLQIEKEPALSDRRLMQDALDELQEFMEDTIDLARCGGSREPLLRLNIGSLLESMADDYRGEGKPVALLGSLDKFCLVHPTALRRCIDNLVGNALRYGGSAQILLEDLGGQVRLSILDNGPGIAQEHLEDVFQPFFRLEASRNKKTGGTGLGLSIAQGLAALHNSRITLANNPRGGLCASFCLNYE